MSKPDIEAPDYTPLAEASKAATERMGALGEAQLDFSKLMYEENAPALKKIAEQQGLMMGQQLEQAQDYYADYKQTYRPMEQKFVRDAQNFNTDAYRNQLATKAAADSGLAFNRTRQANERAMASMGVNPNSGRFQGLAGQSALMQSANRAGAMTGTRERAQQMGYARNLDAIGIGRNLPGLSRAAYGSAAGAGSMAGGNYQSAGINRLSGMGQGAATIGSGLNMGIGGLSSVLNAETQMAVVNTEHGSSFLGDLGGIMGGAASIYTAFSDARLKENIEHVGVDERTKLNLYEFNYKWDDKVRFKGVMAGEVQKVYPEAVSDLGGVFAGYLGVDYDMLGLEMTEVQ